MVIYCIGVWFDGKTMNAAPLKPLLSLEIFHFAVRETKTFRLKILFDSRKDMVMKYCEPSL